MFSNNRYRNVYPVEVAESSKQRRFVQLCHLTLQVMAPLAPVGEPLMSVAVVRGNMGGNDHHKCHYIFLWNHLNSLNCLATAYDHGEYIAIFQGGQKRLFNMNF